MGRFMKAARGNSSSPSLKGLCLVSSKNKWEEAGPLPVWWTLLAYILPVKKCRNGVAQPDRSLTSWGGSLLEKLWLWVWRPR